MLKTDPAVVFIDGSPFKIIRTYAPVAGLVMLACVPDVTPIEDDDDADGHLYSAIRAVRPEPVSGKILRTQFVPNRMSRATWYRAVDRLVGMGLIETFGKGSYRFVK